MSTAQLIHVPFANLGTGEHSQELQPYFPHFPIDRDVLPVGEEYEEIEEKFVSPNPDCEKGYREWLKLVRTTLLVPNWSLLKSAVEFDGLDYCTTVVRDDTTFSFRFRTGAPINYRVAFKKKVKGVLLRRKECEYYVNLDTPLDTILAKHRLLAESLGGTSTETRLRVWGNTLNFRVPTIPGAIMEVVVMMGRNPETGKTVTAMEIEAHHLKFEEATKHIGLYRDILGVAPYRTERSMPQLVV
jgi:hypothetical protein